MPTHFTGSVQPKRTKSVKSGLHAELKTISMVCINKKKDKQH